MLFLIQNYLPGCCMASGGGAGAAGGQQDGPNWGPDGRV